MADSVDLDQTDLVGKVCLSLSHLHVSVFTVLQIRRGNRDNLGIMVLMRGHNLCFA